MFPYYILVGTPLLFSFFYGLYDNGLQAKKKKNYNIIIFFVIYFFLLAFRDVSVGIDLSSYLYYFNRVESMSWKAIVDYNAVELGYLFLNKAIQYISKDFQVFLGVAAAICCIPMAFLYYKESENGVISILLYLTATSIFVLNFSGLRQAIAIAFAVPAFYCVKNKKIIKFIILVFIATFFHTSAWIMLIMYPVYHIKLGAKHAALLITPAVFVTFLFRNQIFNFLLKFVGEEYEEKYSSTENTGATTMIILIALFVIFSFIGVDKAKEDSEFNGFRNILVISLFLQLFATVNNVAMRFNYYFLLFLPITVTKVMNRASERDKSIMTVISIIFILFFTFYYFYDAYTGADILQVYPYVSIFGQ